MHQSPHSAGCILNTGTDTWHEVPLARATFDGGLNRDDDLEILEAPFGAQKISFELLQGLKPSPYLLKVADSVQRRELVLSLFDRYSYLDKNSSGWKRSDI